MSSPRRSGAAPSVLRRRRAYLCADIEAAAIRRAPHTTRSSTRLKQTVPESERRHAFKPEEGDRPEGERWLIDTTAYHLGIADVDYR
jgi:hypothetical protein